MSQPQATRVIPASQVRSGQRLWDAHVTGGMRVQRVTVCNDGSLRIITETAEQRVTAFIRIRVLN